MAAEKKAEKKPAARQIGETMYEGRKNGVW